MMNTPFLPRSVTFLIVFAFLFFKSGITQNLNDYGFDPWLTPKVYINNEILSNAWAGGLNNVQLGEIDLNMDGRNDLVAFERHGNKLMPFVFNQLRSTNASSQYIFDPSYRRYFPSIRNTFQMHDYNGDLLPDIFTYTTGGIMVYRNISSQELKFEKAVNQFIRSLQGNVFTNLLVTDVDYPAIYDLDLDGDLDILTFSGLGSFVDLHKNMSMETYGSADSLLFHKVDYCWGQFAENDESNELLLDTCVNFLKNTLSLQNDRHTGSTLNVMDINGDNRVDLMLGDVDFMNIQALINDGDGISAHMTQVIDSFPANSPVNLVSFPSMQQIDAYNDGIRDLILSPFTPSLIKSSGQNSVWQYEIRDGGNLTKVTESFLQETMIDRGIGAYPVFRDVNDDQLIDLVVGNYGMIDSSYYDVNGILKCNYVASLAFYINNGTATEPSFRLVSEDLGNLSQLNTIGIKADFSDLNNDGKSDMIVGTGDGKLRIYFKTGMMNDVPVFGVPVEINTKSGGAFQTPTIEDIDNDGLKDIVSGNIHGKLSYFKNTGSLNAPEFSFVTHDFGSVNVTDPLQSYTGYSVPFIFRSKSGNLRMVVGSESGKLFYYPALPATPTERISPKDDVFITIKEGFRTSVCISDINNDSYLDMVVGNYAGGVNLFKGVPPGPSGIGNFTKAQQLEMYPNPAVDEVIIILPETGKWEVYCYDIFGQLVAEDFLKSGKNRISLNKMRSGLYLIVASQSNILLTGKLTIIR